MTQTEIPHLKLINGIFCLLSDNLNCSKSWGFYLFSPEFDSEPELRNRIGAIWLCSLLDSLEGEQRKLAVYRDEAEKLNLQHLVAACDEVEEFVHCVEEVVGLYTREEQIFLADYRDQCVHSWLGRRHNPDSRFKFFDGEELRFERLTTSEHAQLVRPFYEHGFGQGLYDLLGRFNDRRLRYWHVTFEMMQNDKLTRWYADLRAGRFFSFDSLHRTVSGEAEFTTADVVVSLGPLRPGSERPNET